ncbi:MAG: InlB B-repeat-containing protein [Candidatus Omnitrophica bacterium]|nr:InlB B-repeat-containing protein [Candidatus Omnitrophota bacterium]
MKRLVIVLVSAFIILNVSFVQSPAAQDSQQSPAISQSSCPQCAAQVNTTADIAVCALIKFSSPNINQADVKSGNLTTTQISALKTTMDRLAGKKFIILNGKVVILDSSAAINITNTKDVISIQINRGGVNQGSAVLADLTELNTQNVCNTNDPWYAYLSCMLGNLSKKAPGTAIGDDPLLRVSIKAYLDRRFASIGGFDANFEISAAGNYVKVSPKPTSNLQGLEKAVSFSFENDPMVYDKRTNLQFFQSFLTDTSNPDLFFVVSDNTLDSMSVYDINDIIMQVQAPVVASKAKVTSLSLSLPEPGCYTGQSGSVIPCNNQIDWIDGIRAVLSRYVAPIKSEVMQLAKLGYKINSIEGKSYPKDGVAFLKAIVKNTRGQVLLLNFHGEEGGFIFPIGCVEKADAGPGGRFERGLANDPDFISLFKDGHNPFPTAGTDQPWQSGLGWFEGNSYICTEVLVSPKLLPAPIYLAWGVRINDLKIPQKAIESGIPCFGQASVRLENARAIYLGQPELPNQIFKSLWDMKLFCSYMLGYGPQVKGSEPAACKNHYDKYPLDFAGPNPNVSNIMGFGGPTCTTISQVLMSRNWADVKSTNLSGQQVFADIPSIMESKLQISDAHLFPYITSLDLQRGGMDSQVNFSDGIGILPTIDFKIKGKNAIKTGPTRSSSSGSLFTFSLIPEVEVVDQEEYDKYYNVHKDGDIPKSILTIKDAQAEVNGIKMIGNPLAIHTSEDKAYKQAYFSYNKYFWYYNARAYNSDIHSFKANVPYKLHPYVEGVYVDGSQGFSIQLSMGAPGAELPNSSVAVNAGNLVSVDCSACGNTVFSEFPRLLNGSITFELNRSPAKDGGDGLYLYPGTLPDNWKNQKVIVKVDGVSSPWNNFPLLGNRPKEGNKWLQDMNGNGIPDWKEGNSDQFPQQAGPFEVWIPCVPQPPDTYTLSVTTNGNGSVSKSLNQQRYAYNTAVTLSAKPDKNSYFLRWMNGATVVSTANPYRVGMTQNKSLTAEFAKGGTVTVTSPYGSVSKTPNQSLYAPNTAVALRAAPNAGYCFVSWSGSLSSTSNPVTVIANGDKAITANYAPIVYTLSVTTNGNGSVSKSPSQTGYAYNTAVVLKALPNTGSKFVSWSGSLSSTSNPVTVIANSNKVITANYALQTYTLVASAQVGGSLSAIADNQAVPSGRSLAYGTVVTLSAASKAGYVFTGWSGSLTGTANPVKITMNSNKTVTATFTKKRF